MQTEETGDVHGRKTQCTGTGLIADSKIPVVVPDGHRTQLQNMKTKSDQASNYEVTQLVSDDRDNKRQPKRNQPAHKKRSIPDTQRARQYRPEFDSRPKHRRLECARSDQGGTDNNSDDESQEEYEDALVA